MNQQTSRDSITTITQRPIPISISPDTARSTIGLHSFTEQFYNVPVGAIIAQKGKGRATYQIKKVSESHFELEAVAGGKDTTVVVADTHTKVKETVTN